MTKLSSLPIKIRNINLLSFSVGLVVWILPFFFPDLLWLIYTALLLYALFLYRLRISNSILNSEKEYPSLKDYSDLVQNVSPLYEWERTNHPFLETLPVMRFSKNENPTKLEDFQAVYINSKENIIYFFNLINQEPQAKLQGFMIEDINKFYMVIKIPQQQMWHGRSLRTYANESSSDSLHSVLKRIQDSHSIFICSIHLVFEVDNPTGKCLEASLYPPHPDKKPYFAQMTDPHYVSLVEKGINAIALLAVLQGGFFWETKPKISLDGLLRIEFSDN